MSVFTPIKRDQVEGFLGQYNIGHLVSYQGINAGTVNTNYFVTTTQGQFVLTLFEQLDCDELPFFLELMAYLAEHDVPSAHPIADHEGFYLNHFNEKPAALVERLCGKEVDVPTLGQCQAIGTTLGHFHVVSPYFTLYRPNGHGPKWWKITAEQVLPYLEAADVVLLQSELDFQAHFKHLDLPRGVIHADLFRDNALFHKEQLCGIIDFYFACHDVLIYDVAVTVNDWCRLPEGGLDESRLQALLDNYNQERTLTALELEIWPAMLRAAALRFWLSRLQALYFPRLGEITQIKDPNVFKNLLQYHRNHQQQKIPFY